MKTTVGDLIAQLENFNQNVQIAMSQDSEGNGYSADVEPELVGGVVVLYPGYMDDISELEDYEDDEEDIE